MDHNSQTLILAASLATAAVALGPAIRAILRHRHHEALAEDLLGTRWPVRLLALTLFLRIALLSRPRADGRFGSVVAVVLVVASAWLLIRLLRVGQQALYRRLAIDRADNLRARSRRTQLEIVRRMTTVAVVVGAVAVIALTVTPLGRFGPSLVAYAGLVGVILGVALRAPLENLVAGVTVATTEPIRIDDVVVVEDEWGRVEEIGLVNVVVRLWDDRRLVLPTSYFVENAFENWTRRSAHVTGTLLLWVDYDLPIPELRAAFDRILAEHPLWDGRGASLQVVDLSDRAVQVRATVTAADATASWDLRCDLREGLLAFLSDRPDGLPRLRTQQDLVELPR